jgi:hypothetical protein
MSSTAADNNNDPDTDPNTDVSDTEALPEDYVSMRTWFTVWGSVIGAFIAVLNIMITNSSLKEIQGALSATLHEGSFISTAYLTAEVIVIPLTGWLVQVFGLRRFVLSTSLVFMAATLACAMAWNLERWFFYRAVLHRYFDPATTQQTASGHRHVFPYRHPGSQHWSNPRRLSHRNHRLAVDFLYADYSHHIDVRDIVMGTGKIKR